MITKYFTGVTVKIPVKGHASKLGRIFINQIPPRQRADVKLDLGLLYEENAKSIIQVKFKDGKTIDFDPTSKTSGEMIETFDRYSRRLRFQDQLNE